MTDLSVRAGTAAVPAPPPEPPPAPEAAPAPNAPVPAPAPAAALTFRQTLAALSGHLRPHRGELALACTLLVLSGVAGLLEPLVVRDLLSAFGAHHSLGTSLGRLIGLVLGSAVVLAVGNFLLLRAAEGVVLAGRKALVAQVLRLPMGVMRRQQPGDLLARVAGDTSLLRQVVTQTLVQALTGVVTVVGTLVLMGVVDLVLLAVTLGVVGVLGTVVGVLMPRIRKAALAAQTSVGSMAGSLERALGSFTTVKASGAEAWEAERIGADAEAAYREGVALARSTSLTGTTAGLAVQLAFLVVLGVGGARVTGGAISLATLVAFLLYVLYLAQPVLSLVNVGTYFQAARAAVQRIAEVSGLPVEPGTGVSAAAGSPAPAAVTFESVGFRYPERSGAALAGVSLHIPATGLTALVGPSGAGKTTMLSLIERFHQPERGRILLDGRDVADWPLPELRAAIGYVEQDAPVLAGTLRENLCYAAPGAGDADLAEALRVTGLDGLVERLGSLDAEILHRGSSLSGGERQRIAIARALLRRPRLLLLDEATSQLDAVNEAALRGAVRDLATRTTVVVVAHRLSTVQEADRIAVLEDGRLRAVGRHAELLHQDALYAELVANQLLH
ncbi:ABC transporter ATP-binding protein [Kitasatospora sp. NPDC058965]|uniref:ABC transporter ATP-binding protein n=1 Tax=Kitasatospora sp. NPDC058965 TaxID=3346682 RepID=UPI0036B755AB